MEASERTVENVKSFARYIFGDDNVDLSKAVISHSDTWMIRGRYARDVLQKIDEMPLNHIEDVTVLPIGSDLIFFQVKNDIIDPGFQLEAVYELHRKLIKRFLFALSTEDKNHWHQLVTDRSSVRAKGASSEEGTRFSGIFANLPVQRFHRADDEKLKSVVYSVPMGSGVLNLSLVKNGNTWRVDTAKGLDVDFRPFRR